MDNFNDFLDSIKESKDEIIANVEASRPGVHLPQGFEKEFAETTALISIGFTLEILKKYHKWLNASNSQ